MVIILLLVIPLIQARYHLFREAGLSGAVNLKPKPNTREITWKKWMKEDFHDDFLFRVEDYAPFHNTLYRIGCQLDYSFFRIRHAMGFISGRNGCLFDKAYLREFSADYFIGQKTLDRKLTQLKSVYDSLKSNNVNLVLVFEPVKSSFYRDNIPDEFNPRQKNISNYLYSLQKLQKLGLPYLDLDHYLRSVKDTCRFSLFPENGNSWSNYARDKATETLVDYLKISKHKDLPTKRKLSVLVISDTGYHDFITNLSSGYFTHTERWFPYAKSNPVPFDRKTLAEKLKRFDVILFMTSELNLHYGYGDFPDEAYLSFHPEVPESRIYRLENDIRNTPDWFLLMVDKAKQQNHTFEEMARIDAEYIFFTGFNDLKDKTRYDSIEHITLKIKQDPAWLAKVIQKAQEQQVTIDTMLYRDATFTYNSLLHKNEKK